MIATVLIDTFKSVKGYNSDNKNKLTTYFYVNFRYF